MLNANKRCDCIDNYSKFRKAIRYEIPLVNIDYNKVWKSGGMRVTPEDLLKSAAYEKATSRLYFK